jgi:hypothetical protein
VHVCSFFVGVARTVAPPPPPLPAPPPPYFNAIEIVFSVTFANVQFSFYAGSLVEIRERLLLVLVTKTGVDRCAPLRPSQHDTLQRCERREWTGAHPCDRLNMTPYSDVKDGSGPVRTLATVST